MATSSSEFQAKAEGSSGGGGGGGETSAAVAAAAVVNEQTLIYRGLKKAKKERGCTAKERISKMPPCAAGKRSSIYRGVTRHRWTGRYEAHLWDKSTWNQNQNKKGKQVYLGAYDEEEAAARAYDLAALKYWGPGTLINFPVTDYTRDLEEMQNVTREDYLASLRRKSSGFSRGLSKYRGLSRWDSSLGRLGGADYFNISQYGDDATTDKHEFIGGFCVDRKIDLTNYIKWWGPTRSRQEEMKNDDISNELKTLEWAMQPTEPYQMPRFSQSNDNKNNNSSSKTSAMSILSRSAAFKSLQEKASQKKESVAKENEDKNCASKMNYGKAIEKSLSNEECGLGLTSNPYPLTSFLTAPLLTGYNAVDPMVDPVLWTSLVNAVNIGTSHTTEVTKTEATSSDYGFFQHEN